LGIKTGNTEAQGERIGTLCLEMMVIQDLLEAVNQFFGRGLKAVHGQDDKFIPPYAGELNGIPTLQTPNVNKREVMLIFREYSFQNSSRRNEPGISFH
jgi:hypothetical protein